ncbi:MAG TPA: TRAP transporter large permease subunit [Stellaceae bacterium]|jgi:TRAP-type C4-dicarboxylate transport system permease large subunit|nr:TRAP transporter large permease subunit [Stellaceae bacterium]
MAAVPGGSCGFLAITIVAFIILGSVLEGLPAIVLFGPLLFPVAKTMGVHEVHYAMVVILAMGIGLFAPPFGVGFYGACAIGRTTPDDSLWRYLALYRRAGRLAVDRRGNPVVIDRVPVGQLRRLP